VGIAHPEVQRWVLHTLRYVGRVIHTLRYVGRVIHTLRDTPVGIPHPERHTGGYTTLRLEETVLRVLRG